MLKKLFNFLFTNNNTKITKPIKKRKLQFETLESRELLSVSFAEFDAIRSQYADLELSANMNDYNVIEITAAQLSDANLRNAITTAGTTTKNDLIVIRNNKNAIVDLKDKSLEINIDTTIFGSIGIVSLGQNKLQLQSNSSSGVISVLQGDLILGGVVLTGTENSQQESLDTSALLQTGINADVQTSQVIKITENSNRAGNFTIFTDANTSTKLQSTSGGSPIGSKSYSITVDVDGASGSLEAYLTGLTETEKNSIIAGSTSFLSTLNPFDAEKNGNGDRDHCWAGTSSNMLAYTGWGNVNGFQTEDDIFDYFRTNFTDAGGRSFYGNEWFITGSYGAPTDDGWAQLQSINTGCFYPDINIKNFAADSCSMKSAIAITSAVDKLKDNAAIGLSIGWFSSSHDRTGGHAITMWGVIYDTSKSSTNNDYYVSLLVSDSDDNKNNGANAKNVLKSLNIAYDTTYSSYKFTNYSSGGYLEDYTWLSQYSDNPVDTIPTPTNFRTTAQTSSYITLQWDAVTDAQYFLRRRALNQSTWTTRTSSTTSGNFACDADTTYEWQLCAVKDGKYSNWTTIFASTTITSLATPANFNSTTQTEDSVTLSWNIVNNAISYEIQYKKTTQTEWTTWTNSLKPSATSTTITNLESGTSYQFQIRSINGNTLSSWQPANATTKIPPIIAPANFISVSQTHDSVTLNWNIQSNLSSYKLEYKKSSTSTWQTWTAPDISATSATITGLDALTQYDFRLTATNANGS
ncbi:MAG: fibronectin type III domain-containing protein, partial [Planctomycetaceae bacterium]|nr:fibronectin type III domain-containing protein [Planctomycetaceae bacterium]